MKAVNSCYLDLIHAACSEMRWLGGSWHIRFEVFTALIRTSYMCGCSRPGMVELLSASSTAQWFEANVYQMLGEQKLQ